MRHQPGLAYATRHETFQQAKNIPFETNSEKEKTTATRVKPPCEKVEIHKSEMSLKTQPSVEFRKNSAAPYLNFE